MNKRILVVAPHPDDEVLGVGGTIARFAAEGAEVIVLIVTRGFPPEFDEEFVERGRKEAAEAHELLGVTETVSLSFPAAGLDTVPHRDLNAELASVFRDVRPDILFLPFNGDVHSDHQSVFHSSLVAARPNRGFSPSSIHSYETLSETNWNAPFLTPGFRPNVFVDITDHLEIKLRAMEIYASQIRPFPNERSAESLRALAMLRGSTVGWPAAEAFVLLRALMADDIRSRASDRT